MSDSKPAGPKTGGRPALTEGPILKAILSLAGPMVIGILAIMAMNVIDTFFVGQLGTVELAAMAFTFPVVFIVGSIALGLGVGTTSVIARAIGGGDRTQVRRLTTDSFTLSLSVVAVVGTIGYLSMVPIFEALGATEETLPYILDYMSIWFFGMICIVVPMVGNSAIRATGDAKTPAVIMITAALMNIALDPIFIFGWGPVPAMGIEGAAIATVISRSMTLLLSLYVLTFREGLIAWSIPKVKAVFESWKAILEVGLPAAATNLVVPFTAAILTRFVAEYGEEAIAAFGAGTRIEAVAGIAAMAVGSAMGPFMGQNWGAGRLDRVSRGLKISERMAFAWGVGIYAVVALLAEPIAGAFTESEGAREGIVLFLRLALIGQAFQGVYMVASSTFNAIGQPLKAVVMSILRNLVMAAPFAWVGSELFGLMGIFGGLALANMLIGLIAYVWIRPLRAEPRPEPAPLSRA